MANDISVTFGGDATQWKQTVDSMGKGIGDLAGKLAVLGGGISVGAFFKEIIDDMNKIDDISSNLDVSTDFVQTLQRAADLGGASLESITTAFEKLQINLAKGDGVDALKKLGLELSSIRAMNSEDAFMLIGQKINELPDYSMKASVATDLLGKSSKDLMDTFSKLKDINPLDNYKEADIRKVADATDYLATKYKNFKSFVAVVLAETAQGISQQIQAFQTGTNVEQIKADDEHAAKMKALHDEADKRLRERAKQEIIAAEESAKVREQADLEATHMADVTTQLRLDKEKEAAKVVADLQNQMESERADQFKQNWENFLKSQETPKANFIDVAVGGRQSQGLYEQGFGNLQSKLTDQTKVLDLARQQLQTLKRIETKLDSNSNSFIVRD